MLRWSGKGGEQLVFNATDGDTCLITLAMTVDISQLPSAHSPEARLGAVDHSLEVCVQIPSSALVIDGGTQGLGSGTIGAQVIIQFATSQLLAGTLTSAPQLQQASIVPKAHFHASAVGVAMVICTRSRLLTRFGSLQTSQLGSGYWDGDGKRPYQRCWGSYLVLRDCEESTQVWSSCSDVTIKSK